MKSNYKILISRITVVFYCYVIISFSKLEATPIDSNSLYMTTLFIGHINTNKSIDTIIGKAGYDRKFIPRYILWGSDTTNNDYPDSLKLKRTDIIYPNWYSLKVKLNVDFLNSDTLNDMMFIMWGKLMIDSANYKDTVKSLVIFGQKGLDTLHTINISQMDTLQIEPFIAMKLRMGTDLTDCQIRDFSYKPSYIINKINTDNYQQGGTNSIIDKILPSVKIYPNPAIYYTNLELNQIKPGKYKIEIISLNGVLIEIQQFENQRVEKITSVLNLQNLATGIYYLKISTDNELIGTYPLIIVH